MIGWLVAWKCLVACLFGESSQHPTCPQVRQRRRCTQLSPLLRHSSHPRGVLGAWSLAARRCAQSSTSPVTAPTIRAYRSYPPAVASTRGATVEFRNVSKRYPGQLAVDQLSFTVPAGKICILVGPSGPGKSTSLKMVNRLIEPSGGSILINGQD